MYSKCCGQLFIVPVPMVTLRSITTPWQDWCMWVLRSAAERDRLPGSALWKLTKLEPNIQCTRLPMQSTGNCALVVQRGALPIEIWTTDRQDERSDICVKAGQNDSDQWCYQMNCIVCLFRYKVAHSGNWQICQIWKQIFNTQAWHGIT